MKIEKYLTNKDITLTNDDIDTAKLIKDLQNGMISEDDANARLENAKKEWEKESTKTYTDLEAKYNDLEKRNGDLTTANARLKLENIMVKEGFEEKDFDEVAKIRSSLYENEPDDLTAIQGIKKRFGSTYVQNEKSIFTSSPDEGAVRGDTNEAKSEPVKITRNTSLKDLLIK